MAFNKKEEFDDDVQKVAQFAKALSHPARVAILKTLAQKIPVYAVKLLRCCHWRSRQFLSI
jgi:DNA-binding transcriptional ArsR family regulator